MSAPSCGPCTSAARSPPGSRRRATASTASPSTTTTSTSLESRRPQMSESFNASVYLLDRQVEQGGGDRLALTGPEGDHTYAQLRDRVARTAAGLRAAGLRPEQRVLMFMADSPDFVTVFLAAMRIGAIPVPVST